MIITGLGLAILPLAVAIVLVVVFLTLAATAIRLEWGLYLLILAIPLGSLVEVPLGALRIGAAEALAVWLVLLWVGEMGMRRRLELPRVPLLRPLIFFLFIIAFSVTAAVSLEHALKGMLLWLEFALVYLFVVAKVEPQEVTGLIYVSLVAGASQALLGGYQFFSGTGPESFQILGQFTRAYGTFGQPNPFGGYLGLLLPLAVGLALGRGSQASKGFLERSLVGGALALLLLGLGFSWSRGAWLASLGSLLIIGLLGLGSNAFSPLGLSLLAGGITAASALLWVAASSLTAGALALGTVIAFGSAVFFYLSLRSRWVLVFLGILLFLGVMLWVLGIGGPVSEVASERFLDFLPYLGTSDVRFVPLTDENYAVLERLALWQAATAMIHNNPWLGVGIGNYVPAYPGYALPGWEDPLGHAHNYYLHIAAETGIPGLLAYVGLWVMAFIQGFRILFSVSESKRGLVLGVLGMMVALSLHNVVDNLYVQGMNLQVAIFLALLTVLQKARQSY